MKDKTKKRVARGLGAWGGATLGAGAGGLAGLGPAYALAKRGRKGLAAGLYTAAKLSGAVGGGVGGYRVVKKTQRPRFPKRTAKR